MRVIRKMSIKSCGSLKVGWLLEEVRRDSFAEVIFGLGLEGWIGFHVKKAEGHSEKKELRVRGPEV